MNRKIDSYFWSNIQEELKRKYPQLTDADLFWREGSDDDRLQIIAVKLGISTRELKEIVGCS